MMIIGMYNNITPIFNEDRLAQMWESTRFFLTLNMPLIMIGVAILVLAAVIGIIIWIFTRRNPNDDDDDPGYDII